MAISRREKALAIGTIAVVGLLAVDQYFLTPLFDDEDRLEVQRKDILSDMQRARKLLADRKELMPKWNNMLKTGLKSNPAEAEGQLLHSLRDWAKETGLALSSVKPERPESKDPLKQIDIQANATGSMEAVAKFMCRMQTAEFPIKLTEFQLSNRSDASSELALQFKLSTLYNEPELKVAKSEKTQGTQGAVAR